MEEQQDLLTPVSQRIFSTLDSVVFCLVIILLVVYTRRRRVERFRRACKAGDFNAVESLLNYQQIINTILGLTSEQVSIGLMWACSEGHLQVVDRLLQVESLYGNRFSVASCFMCACKRGHVTLVQRLLQESRIPIDTVNKDGRSPEEVTQVGQIKEMVRREHWRRVKEELTAISTTINLTMDSLRRLRRDDTSGTSYLRAMELKAAELNRKAEIIERKERRELSALLARFREEEQSILARYKEQTMELRHGLAQDVQAFKCLDFGETEATAVTRCQ